MPNQKLHIVSFDVPYPPDYGGSIDVYYKIKHLAEAGTEIYLHCFDYGRGKQEALEPLCKQVFYYPRATGIKGLSLTLPYIVYSRRCNKLLQNLIEIDAPILFEGVHTTYYLDVEQLAHRYKAIRNHNIEHEYYNHLYHKEHNILKKLYYLWDSNKLHFYEDNLSNASAFFPLSINDSKYFQAKYPQQEHAFIGPFHPYSTLNCKSGSGNYCLYHGNLAHPENIEAVLWLLTEIFCDTDMPLIVAGRNPSKEISEACNELSHVQLIPNPSSEKIQELIENAHILTLPTFQPTGMKLKLLYSLFNGRHVLVTNDMISGTDLQDCCHVNNTVRGYLEKLNELRETPFTLEEIGLRKRQLDIHYNNKSNAEKLLTYLQR